MVPFTVCVADVGLPSEDSSVGADDLIGFLTFFFEYFFPENFSKIFSRKNLQKNNAERLAAPIEL